MKKESQNQADYTSTDNNTEGSPEKAAWLTAFYIENHLDHFAYPYQVASLEQMQFMVYLEEDQRYYPCSDQMFDAIINRNQPEFIQREYQKVLDHTLNLVNEKIEDKKEKRYLETLITTKYRHDTRDEMMIPSRLQKRLTQIFMNRTQIEDPSIFDKSERNQRASLALDSKAYQTAMNHLEPNPRNHLKTLSEIKMMAEHLELKRLFSLTGEPSLWQSAQSHQLTKDDYLEIFNRPIMGNGVTILFELLETRSKEDFHTSAAKKILWLADEAGEIVIDLTIISFLAKQGHKIILAFKEGPMFTKVNFLDAQNDAVIMEKLNRAVFIKDTALNKNDLVKILRRDIDIIALSDGTREDLNLLLTSTTFARAFREVDLVISRGRATSRRFFDTHFQFTQDIFNITAEKNGTVLIQFKPKHLNVIKFSHADLEKKAKTIIDQMKSAKSKGMTVIFYSGIIGSIPGKIRMAKKIMSVFVEHLKKQSALTHIINPSDYYEPGMDADDLMYMWEIVQTSGFVDIWRFQSYVDILESFKIMGRKVPPEWVGKDATYSTGCTKEMRIAQRVQKRFPEMQIIGPAKEKFMRRDEYGVGKMYDERF
jgi:damage control phosphatase ARMT1-like protein